jgi:hypothetical protein
MSYETVIIYDDDEDRVEINSERYPIDFVSGSPMTDPNIAPVATTVRVKRYTGRIRVRRPVSDKSPGQDAMSVSKAGQGPKTLGDTNEFISAFWINGKPKCRKGYRYDFRRKMCRLIK